MPTGLTPVDDDLAGAFAAERDSQRETLSLVARENHASEAVLAAQGPVLTDKYAEGTARDLCREYPVYPVEAASADA
jgi:glycine hydroxymethyltransferase